MHLILTGATGLVGSAVLHTMLTTPSVSKISILSRRPVTQAEGHEKAQVIIQKDFSVYEKGVLEELKDAHGVVWALGISSTQVDKTEYERITHEYPLAFAKAIAATTSPNPVTFIYVSGEGATTTPGMMTPHWAGIKGRTESELLALSKTSNLRAISLRPGGVDPKEHTEIHEYIPKQKGMMKLVEATLLPPLRVLMPRMMSPTRELGKVLTELALGEGKAFPEKDEGVSGEGRTLNNVAQRRLAGF
ncbi:uncharacterized protein LY89DRAFT_587662 [Mollisia scopiformis]|uniref:NAD(P)-binding domain-containing protein n=1 Tax=Mollisia scopiformis TaxID=149040 RepID=A0A194X6Z7_MOLSC|nr:uncharacterized protein LY89DRAFT_587662 [Mollisia scopiformis]KUJ15953.1 hypothetical protein LY89DRAFT_587662 [Mollisia scopiformis]